MSLNPDEESSELQFWHAKSSTHDRGSLEKRCLAWLSEDEKSRMQAFKVISSQNQYLVGKGMARWLLSSDKSRLNELVFEIEAHGKPFVSNPESSRKPFNLSHTDGLVGCLIGCQSHLQVGVDVEGLDRRTSTELANRYFAAPEIAHLERVQDPVAKKKLFLKIWTLKEAFIKAIGTGLRTPLSDFAFHHCDDSNPKIEFLNTHLQDQMEWHFQSFEPLPGFIASTAVACRTGAEAPPLTIHTFVSQFRTP